MPVKLSINNREIEAPPGPSIFDYADQLDVRVPTTCQKQGKCKECMVEVTEGMDCLTPRTEQEEHLKDQFRLSCRTKIATESGTVTCHTMRRASMQIEESASALPAEWKTLPLEPAVTRDGNRILLDGEEIDQCEGPIHGLALDLGTTTVVLRLINLETGQLLASTSFENPQRFGGSDVMARIKYDTDNKGKLLQRTLLGYLSHAIEDFPGDPQSIYELVVGGNSTMRDLFFGLSVYSIGQMPYRSITQLERDQGKRETTGLSTTARRLRLPIHPKARIVGLPIISGHVGADTSACLLAIDLANEDRLVAMMDIGTNTELVVGNKNRILAASCPAGPAFEGGAISCGMPGLDGAIERIVIDENGTFQTQVIGGNQPDGICGSGLIDLLGELKRTGRMNDMGRFKNVDRYMIDDGHNIYFQESDVNELAQAKGANVSGQYIVLSNYGIKIDDLDMFYLAGAFGRHIDINAARSIGLIPDLPDDRIQQIGNASIEGCCMALLSLPKRRGLEDLIHRIEHVELETHPQFFDYFVEGCQFKPLSSH